MVSLPQVVGDKPESSLRCRERISKLTSSEMLEGKVPAQIFRVIDYKKSKAVDCDYLTAYSRLAEEFVGVLMPIVIRVLDLYKSIWSTFN